jgi:hypothetical protein
MKWKKSLLTDTGAVVVTRGTGAAETGQAGDCPLKPTKGIEMHLKPFRSQLLELHRRQLQQNERRVETEV